jgi:cobalt/nickel transport system permease protein
MAHIHLQDGAFPIEWLVLWWVLALGLLVVLLVRLRRRRVEPRQLTLAALCTATVFALFQVSIPIFGGVHLSLMPLVGVLLGPLLGTVVALVVNIFSALIGHGGWGLIGANLLVNIVELSVAYLCFHRTANRVESVFVRGTASTFLALLAGNLAMIGIVLVSGIQGVAQETLSIATGLAVIGAINMGVGAVEAVVTGYLLAYIGRVRPELIGGRRDAGV